MEKKEGKMTFAQVQFAQMKLFVLVQIFSCKLYL